MQRCPPTSTIRGIDHAAASERNPTTAAPPITADGPHPSIRAFQSQGQTVRERTEWQVCSGKMRECGDKHVQLVKPSMLNFAKTDAELRPLYALLILSTYGRIKKHLLTN